MVSSISPGTTGASALGVDPRYTRAASGAVQQRNEASVSADRVEIGDASSWLATRESVQAGLTHLRAALSIGQDAQIFLGKVQELATASPDDADAAQAELDKLLADFDARVRAAIEDGASLLSGQSLSVQAEPGALPINVAGLDLQVKDDPDGVLALGHGAAVDGDLAKAAQASLTALQQGLERLAEATRALEAHQGFLGAAQGAANTNVRTDLDADAARLLALQVRQGLDAAGGAAIANVEPQAVLALFRA
jgi:hypothetical protein